MKSAVGSLPTEIPVSGLCQFLGRFDLNDPSLELSESDVAALANYLDRLRVFFNSSISTAGIPEIYLDMFRILCSGFYLYSSQAKNQAKSLESQNDKLREEIAQLKLKNDELAIQQSHLSSLKTQISMVADANSRMQKEMEDQTEQAQRNMIKGICKKLNMRTDIENENVFVDECRKGMNKDVALCAKIVDAFDLPRKTKPETVVSALQERLGKDIRRVAKLEMSQHESEMEDAQKELDVMKSALTKSQSKIKRLKHRVSVIPELQEEKFEMIEALRKQKREIRKLESCLSPEKQDKVNSELDKVMQLLDEMSEQSAQQASELAEAVANRSVLVAAIEKLLAVNQQLEEMYEEKLQQQESRPLPKPNDSAIQLLKSIANRSVVEVCESQGSVDNKVGRIVEIVNSELSQCKNMMRSLESVVYGQVKFLNLLTSSRDLVSSVVIDGNSVEDVICVVRSQIARCQYFIQEHAMGFVDDPSVFEELLGKGDTADLLQMLESYLSEYDEPSTPEARLLFVMFVEAVSACDVLRRFAESARENAMKHSADIRNVQASANRMKLACDKKCRSILQEAEAKTTRVVEGIRSVLRGAVIDSNVTEPIIESLEKLNEFADISDREYIDSLQKQIAQLQLRVADLSDEKAAVLEQAKSDLSQVQDLFETLKRESQEKLVEKSTSISRLESEVVAKETVINNIKNSNRELQALNKQLQEELTASTEEHEAFKTEAKRVIEDLQSELSNSRADYEQLATLAKEQTETSIEQDENLETLQKSLSKLKSKNGEMKARFAQQSEQLQAQYEESQEQLQRLASKSAKAVKDAKSLRRKYTSIQSLSKSLQSERNELAKELDFKKRAVALLETQTKMQLLEKDREAREKIELTRSELANTLQSFLVKICKIFYDYVDVEQPITVDSVLAFLPRVKADIEAIPWLRQVEQAMLQVKQQLNAEELADVPDEIHSIQDCLSQMKSEHEQLGALASRVSELETWIGQVFALCYGGAGAVDDIPVMQKRIEERLYTAAGEPTRNEVQSLRTQKQILTSPKYRSTPMPKSKTGLRHVIVAVSFVIRLRKAVACMENVLGVPPREDVQTTANVNGSVFGQFVISD